MSAKGCQSRRQPEKNVLKQLCFSLCIAYEQTGFVHMDLHAGNVLMRPSKKREIDYGYMSLPLQGKYALIMDLYQYWTLN